MNLRQEIGGVNLNWRKLDSTAYIPERKVAKIL